MQEAKENEVEQYDEDYNEEEEYEEREYDENQEETYDDDDDEDKKAQNNSSNKEDEVVIEANSDVASNNSSNSKKNDLDKVEAENDSDEENEYIIEEYEEHDDDLETTKKLYTAVTEQEMPLNSTITTLAAETPEETKKNIDKNYDDESTTINNINDFKEKSTTILSTTEIVTRTNKEYEVDKKLKKDQKNKKEHDDNEDEDSTTTIAKPLTEKTTSATETLSSSVVNQESTKNIPEEEPEQAESDDDDDYDDDYADYDEEQAENASNNKTELNEKIDKNNYENKLIPAQVSSISTDDKASIIPFTTEITLETAKEFEILLERNNTPLIATTEKSQDEENNDDEDLGETTDDEDTKIIQCGTGFINLINEDKCEDVDECESGLNTCSHSCENTHGSYKCLCPVGFQISSINLTQCEDIDECLIDDDVNNNSPCSHICFNSLGSYECRCPEGFVLQNSTNCENLSCSHKITKIDGIYQCTCPEGFILGSDLKTCEDIDECLIESSCSHFCTNTIGSFECTCPVGFNKSNNNATKNRNCIDINECLNDKTCPEICENTPGSFKCLMCKDGFKYDEELNKCLDINECEKNNNNRCQHLCINYEGGYRCECNFGFFLSDDDFSCLDYDECAKNNGNCSQLCENLNGTYKCSCKENYHLLIYDNATCKLNNLCLENNGNCSHECFVNADGIAECRCPEGYELINAKSCDKLIIDPCLINNGGCSHGCSYNYNNNGAIQCFCPPGYKLFGKSCLDEDPCKKNNGGCSHFCHNVEGKKICSCPPGYILRPNNRVCKEINECRFNRAGCSHGCRNIPGSYECTCPKGFQLDIIENKTCTDFDECSVNNGGCEVFCRNYKGSFRCDCPEGYFLQRDRKTCRYAEMLQCQIANKQPKNGIIKCSGHKTDYGLTVPTGTKCNIYCNDGFKLNNGNSEGFCNNLGQWSGLLNAECLINVDPNSCDKLPNFEGGSFFPEKCNMPLEGMKPGEVCSLFCRKGYKQIEEFPAVSCGYDLKWSIDLSADILERFCIRESPRKIKDIYIKCPNDGRLNFILPPGQRTMRIQFSQPETNINFQKYVISQPSWGKRLQTVLPVGSVEVKYTAVYLNRTVSCKLTIQVEDKENPEVLVCPNNIEKVLERGQSRIVIYWIEPEFRDNIEIVDISKSRDSGTEFVRGIHHVKYTATDRAGNRAICEFTINVHAENNQLTDLNTLQSTYYKERSGNYLTSASSSPSSTDAEVYYKAVLICPSGAQYESLSIRIPEPGCIWKHIHVQKPSEIQLNLNNRNFLPDHYYPRRISGTYNNNNADYSYRNHNNNNNNRRIHSESRLPVYLRNRQKNEYFRWNRR